MGHNCQMAASDHLSHQLFHGTIETLKPGDIVKPNYEGGTAWATSDMDYALAHTKERTRTGFGNRPGGEYPVHHGNIYEVEPLGEFRNPEKATIFASSQGFRVKGQVASVLGPEDDRRHIKNRFKEFDPSQASYVENGRNG